MLKRWLSLLLTLALLCGGISSFAEGPLPGDPFVEYWKYLYTFSIRDCLKQRFTYAPDYDMGIYHPQSEGESSGVHARITEVLIDDKKGFFNIEITSEKYQIRPFDSLYEYSPYYIPIGEYPQPTCIVTILTGPISANNKNRFYWCESYGLSEDGKKLNYIMQLLDADDLSDCYDWSFALYLRFSDSADDFQPAIPLHFQLRPQATIDRCSIDQDIVLVEDCMYLEGLSLQITPLADYLRTNGYHCKDDIYSYKVLDERGHRVCDYLQSFASYTNEIPDPLYVVAYKEDQEVNRICLRRKGNIWKIEE